MSSLFLPSILSAMLLAGCAGPGITEPTDITLFGMPFISGCVDCRAQNDYPARAWIYSTSDYYRYDPGEVRRAQQRLDYLRMKNKYGN